jgi:hypothetical protein
MTRELMLSLKRVRDLLIEECHQHPIPERWETDSYKLLAELERFMAGRFESMSDSGTAAG